ncbi:MAG: hypothetical protein FWF00_07500 [Endomicrobia bacterium]|nr:hypothetical protein [Endomicrobiia bacterium]MCL2507510.1 hypothetical protein [Endomicrobiia bacterium]
MALTDAQLSEAVSVSKLGKYDLVKLALDWIEVKRHEEDYRRLTQAELIKKSLDDVVTGEATAEKIEELRKKIKARENKAEAEEAKAKK